MWTIESDKELVFRNVSFVQGRMGQVTPIYVRNSAGLVLFDGCAFDFPAPDALLLHVAIVDTRAVALPLTVHFKNCVFASLTCARRLRVCACRCDFFG